jgi:hypothetical protein
MRPPVLLCALLVASCAPGGPVVAPVASPVPVVLPAGAVPAEVVGVTYGGITGLLAELTGAKQP